MVIALYNGKGDGAGYTIKKAKELGKTVVIIQP